MTPSRKSNAAQLVQITERRLSCDRVPRGESPVYEIHLEINEEIIRVERGYALDLSYRKTVDHSLRVYVATWLGGPEVAS